MKHLRRIILVVLAITLLLTMVVGCDKKETSSEKLVIRLAHEDPPDNQWGMGALHFKELVEEKTGGKVEVQIFDNKQLGSGADNIQQLQTEALEMTIIGSDMAQVDGFFEVFDLPYLIRDRDHAKEVLVHDTLLEKCNKVLESHNLVLLGFWENGFRQVTNKSRPIVKPEDLKGLRLRVPNSPIRVAMFEGYGATAVPMSFSELYSALQQGVVDGQENPFGNIWGDKFYEVNHYVSVTNHVFTPISVLVSKPVWDKLDAATQKALSEAARETTLWQSDWAANREKEWIQDILDFGCEVNYDVDVEAFIAASQDIWEMVIERNGEAVKDAIAEISGSK